MCVALWGGILAVWSRIEDRVFKMGKLAFSAICVAALALNACDGGGNNGAGGPVRVCNPVSQDGCEPGEKCTFVIDSGTMDPLLGTTRCVTEGNTDTGGVCTRSVGGAADDCVGGTWCSGGVCTEICSAGPPDTCGPGQGECLHTSGIFEDNLVGFCSGTDCNIFSQDCPKPSPDPDAVPPNESCYLLFTRPGAPTVCFPARADDGQDAPGGQDQLCNSINTCKQGYGCILPDDPDNFQNLLCAYFCDAADTGGPRCADIAGGGPGPDYSCYQLNLVYGDLPDVPDSVGICGLTELWGTLPLETTPSSNRLRSRDRDLSRFAK